MPASVVPVFLPIPVDRPYSYRLPEGMAAEPGSIVRVPLGSRKVIGAVWDDDGAGGAKVDPAKLRDVETVFPVRPLTADLRRFVEWVAQYTISQPGMVLRMVLRAPTALEPEPPVRGVRRIGEPPERLTPARSRVLETLADGFAWSRRGLADAAAVSPSVIDGLVKAGTLREVDLPATPAAPRPDPEFGAIDLTLDQSNASATLMDAIDVGGFSTALIDGVTGSGKTEVYLEAVAEALRRKKQVLVLLPEIALTSQFLERFEQRFGARPGEWHSELAPKARERVWRGVAQGEVRVVVGARSALFLPFPELGLIVVDEEHDLAFKQEDRVTYNARDMAIVRGHISQFPVVLASATPSIESRVNCDNGRYRRVHLPARATGADLPDLQAIDMRRNGPERGRWLAPALIRAMTETLEQGHQSLLFLNRRGFAPLTLCRSCGYRFHCDNCSAWLVEHRFRGTLECHHCGHHQPRPEACPSCGDLDSLTACGPGVERIAEEVTERFPDARAIVLSSDMAGGPARLRKELGYIAEGGVDIVIGTQIVAKGHNFPLMTTVGIVDADLGLDNGDPRATERTFQLLAQVSGRAGRVFGGGRALLQTYMPEHPVMQALVSDDYEAFYAREIAARKKASLPPFSRLAALIVSSPEREEGLQFARALARAAPRDAGVALLGPAEAPLHLIRGRYRFRLLLQSPRDVDLQAYIRDWLAKAEDPKGGVRLTVDVDPQSFL